MSPWDWCGQDATCKRDCFKPNPCKLPDKLRRLAEYEDACYDADGNEVISLDRLRELVKADADGRVYVSQYPNCGMCKWVTIDMFATIEPCKSCRDRAIAEAALAGKGE